MSWLSSLFNSISGKTAQQEAAAEAKAQAAALQAREDKRQADIRAGQQSIDTAFGRFDQPYFDNFRQTYLANYTPQIADQYGRALDKLTATLAGRGMLESTVGANAIGDVQKTRNDAEASVANAATDAANKLRSDVQGAKTNLYNLNLSANDPQAVGAQAQAAATSIVSPQSLPGLGNVFQGALQPALAFNRADLTSRNPQLPWNRFSQETDAIAGAAPTSGRGSVVYGR